MDTIHNIIYIHRTTISKSTINVNKPSMDIAQNINMQYVFRPNARVFVMGHTDQVPPCSVQEQNSMHRTNPGGWAVSGYRLNLGFTQVLAQKKIYTEWWNCAINQMIARGFVPAGWVGKDFPDADFLPMYTTIRTLGPACDLIVSTVAADYIHRLECNEKALVELVKHRSRKLNNTNNNSKMGVPDPPIPPRQVVVHPSWLPPGAPNHWGAATTIVHPGQLPPNWPLAHIPAGGQLGQAFRGTLMPL